MVEIKFLAQVDTEKCTGCGKCANVCPTQAIQVKDKKAQVEAPQCLACPNCVDICPEEAIRKIPRVEPLVFGVDYREVDQTELVELCRKAHLHPQQWLCLCTATRVRDGAAAVLKGAKTPEEIALMTGIRSGCSAYCLMTSMRLLEAYGVELEQPKGYRWYKTTQTLWNVSEEMIKKYPGYFLEEDKDVFRPF
ncbi:MAG: 4Fe-4S binding protein [Deltaproteobacteria bacterium]|jgi:ferredoxin|nr:4Fe-4S binding protein [Deltaproteobacteria bacterium]